MKIKLSILNQDYSLLDSKKDRYLFIAICFAFGVLFINVFVPFNINRWGPHSGIIEFLRLSSYGVIVAGVRLQQTFSLLHAVLFTNQSTRLKMQ